MRNVPFYKHHLGTEEINSVSEVIKSTFLTTGPKTKEFEDEFSTLMGVKYTSGVNSWTNGAIVTLKALGIGLGDEVITTPMSFIATSNVIEHVGAIPVFVDVEKNTGNIDASKINQVINKNTKAILPVHLYGQMCDMVTINQIAKDNNLFVIEDAAHCVDSERDNIRPGELSDAAIFSFYATKNISSGEGGAIVTNNEELYLKIKKLRLHGMNASAIDRYSSSYKHWDMDVLGYKSNMSDIQAALLLPQIKKIKSIQSMRKSIFEEYVRHFDKSVIKIPEIIQNIRHSYHLFTVWVPSDRDKILEKLQSQSIGVAVNYRSIHILKYYKEKYNYKYSSFPNSYAIGESTISLPFYPSLDTEDIKYVSDTLKSFF